MQSDAISLL